jgi:hypothetical protein
LPLLDDEGRTSYNRISPQTLVDLACQFIPASRKGTFGSTGGSTDGWTTCLNFVFGSDGDLLRINAQLVDGLGGGHAWADKFDGSLAHIFRNLQRLPTKTTYQRRT